MCRLPLESELYDGCYCFDNHVDLFLFHFKCKTKDRQKSTCLYNDSGTDTFKGLGKLGPVSKTQYVMAGVSTRTGIWFGIAHEDNPFC